MGKLRKYMQKGGASNTVVVEDKEYVKTNEGEVVKVKNAPKHEDSILSLNGRNHKVPKNKGGVVLNNTQSVISATHENRSRKDELYTYKDEEIKIVPEVAKELSKQLNLPIKNQSKAISPAKFLDLLIEKRNNVVKRYKDPIDSKVSHYRFNAIKANKAVLATLPSTEDLYDLVFNLQQDMKSGGEENDSMQTGGIPIMGYYKDPKYTPIVNPKIEMFPMPIEIGGFFDSDKPDVINVDPNKPNKDLTLEHENIHRNQFYRGEYKNQLNSNLFNNLSNTPPYNQSVYDNYGNAKEIEAYLATGDERQIINNFFTPKAKKDFMNNIIKQSGGKSEDQIARDKAYRTIRPSDYSDLKNYARYLADIDREEWDDALSEEAWGLYTNQNKPLKYLRKSNNVNKEWDDLHKDKKTYRMHDAFEEDLRYTYFDKMKVGEQISAKEGRLKSEDFKSTNILGGESDRDQMSSRARVLGNYTVNKKKDEQGREYLEYRDIWDLPAAFQDRIHGVPFKVSGRVYKQTGGKAKLNPYPYMKGNRPALSTSNGKSIDVLDGRTISMDDVYDRDSVNISGNKGTTFYKSKLKKYIK